MISNTKAEHFESKYYIIVYFNLIFFLFYDTTMKYFFVWNKIIVHNSYGFRAKNLFK